MHLYPEIVSRVASSEFSDSKESSGNGSSRNSCRLNDRAGSVTLVVTVALIKHRSVPTLFRENVISQELFE